MTRLPKGNTFSHYRTHAGAEVDLVLENPSGDTLALEIKRTLSPKLTPGFVESMKTLQATKGYFIIPRGEAFEDSSLEVLVERPQFHQPARAVERNAGPALFQDERLRVLGDEFQQLDVSLFPRRRLC